MGETRQDWNNWSVFAFETNRLSRHPGWGVSTRSSVGLACLRAVEKIHGLWALFFFFFSLLSACLFGSLWAASVSLLGAGTFPSCTVHCRGGQASQPGGVHPSCPRDSDINRHDSVTKPPAPISAWVIGRSTGGQPIPAVQQWLPVSAKVPTGGLARGMYFVRTA